MGRSSVLDLADDETCARASTATRLNLGAVDSEWAKKEEGAIPFKASLKLNAQMCDIRLRQPKQTINISRGVGPLPVRPRH